jgi:hypothetical protein
MASLKRAIENHCKDCIYDESEKGSWRQQVENCRETACHLWEVRPVTIGTREATREAKRINVVEVEE